MICFYEHEKGTKEEVYEMTVNVPPVGMVWDFLEGKWITTEIYQRSEIKEDQYWERPINIDYNRLRKQEREKQKRNPLYVDAELEAFREREWFRRMNGFWFMNNGKPTFITGTHYIYLTWWRIDIGYPHYRDSDRQFFYCWSYCEGDPDSFGLIEAARRRSGKTFRSTIVHYEFPSRTLGTDMFSTIQSKTKPDAAKVFSKLINGFKSLPDFFVPLFDTSGGTRPKNKLIFQEKSSRAADYESPDVELGSEINFESYEILAPDGTRQIRYLRDECFGGEVELLKSDGFSISAKDIEVGDYLMGDDGTPRRVSHVHSGEDKMYRIKMNKSNSWTCNGDHILVMKWARRDQKFKGKSFGEIIEMPVNEYLSLTKSQQKHLVMFFGESSDVDCFSVEEVGNGKYFSIKTEGNQRIRLASGLIVHNCGKTLLADIHVGWGVVKECLKVGTRTIVGKALYTTTIEEGGSVPFKRLWNDSGFQEKDPDTFRTRSGLYRLFTPAHKNDADFIDKYGICDSVAAKDAMQKERNALASSPKQLAEYIRKNPWTIDEAFYSINDECIYDSLKLVNQMKLLATKEEKEWFVRGNLHWIDGIGSDVEFKENFNGKWLIHAKWLEKAMEPESGLINNWEKIGEVYRPISNNTSLTGADTFDHSRKNLKDEQQASNAAFYTLQRHDPMNEEFDNTFLCEYIYRQPSADLMAEDLLKQCVFFGTPAIIENNKPGAISYFERNGYTGFIQKVDGKDGIAGSPKNKQSLAETTEDYIANYVENVVFPNLLDDWNQFSLEDSTAFDAAMGSGWAILIANRLGKKFQKKPDHLDKDDRRRNHVRNVISKHL